VKARRGGGSLLQKLKPGRNRDDDESLIDKLKPSGGGSGSGLFSNTASAAAEKTGDAVKNTVGKATDGIPKPNKLARKLAAKALKAMLKRAAESGAEAARNAAEKAAETGKEVAEKTAEKTAASGSKRPPVQCSIDIGVPIRVAWEEWDKLEFIPEGTHTVRNVERDANALVGQIDGVRETEWAAEVLDERERQSFAWQSHRGSDCAGLITFHELSDRLTRLELNLDIVPTSLTEALMLATRRADHKAELELRRFKARLELINPDVYEEDDDDESDEPDDEQHDEPDDSEDEDFDEDDSEDQAEDEDEEPAEHETAA
jgi:uncharacterized membrane protein